LRSTKWTFAVSVVYGLLALATLIQALQGKPLIKESAASKVVIDKQTEL
jgi:hypothetical protein